MRFLWVVLLAQLALVAGCATRANYEKVLNTWLGASADRLVQKWGAPAGTFRMPNGNDVYIYDWRRSGAITTPVQVNQAPGTFIGNTYFPGATTVTGGDVIPIHRSCRTEFEIANGTVTRWRYEGNACVARAPE